MNYRGLLFVVAVSATLGEAVASSAIDRATQRLAREVAEVMVSIPNRDTTNAVILEPALEVGDSEIRARIVQSIRDHLINGLEARSSAKVTYLDRLTFDDKYRRYAEVMRRVVANEALSRELHNTVLNSGACDYAILVVATQSEGMVVMNARVERWFADAYSFSEAIDLGIVLAERRRFSLDILGASQLEDVSSFSFDSSGGAQFLPSAPSRTALGVEARLKARRYFLSVSDVGDLLDSSESVEGLDVFTARRRWQLEGLPYQHGQSALFLGYRYEWLGVEYAQNELTTLRTDLTEHSAGAGFGWGNYYNGAIASIWYLDGKQEDNTPGTGGSRPDLVYDETGTRINVRGAYAHGPFETAFVLDVSNRDVTYNPAYVGSLLKSEVRSVISAAEFLYKRGNIRIGVFARIGSSKQSGAQGTSPITEEDSKTHLYGLSLGFEVASGPY